MSILSGTLLKNCMSKIHTDLTRSVQGCSLVILNCCRVPALTVRDHVEPLASFCRRYGECACVNNFIFTLRLSTTLSTIWFLVLVVVVVPLPTLALALSTVSVTVWTDFELCDRLDCSVQYLYSVFSIICYQFVCCKQYNTKALVRFNCNVF